MKYWLTNLVLPILLGVALGLIYKYCFEKPPLVDNETTKVLYNCYAKGDLLFEESIDGADYTPGWKSEMNNLCESTRADYEGSSMFSDSKGGGLYFSPPGRGRVCTDEECPDILEEERHPLPPQNITITPAPHLYRIK